MFCFVLLLSFPPLSLYKSDGYSIYFIISIILDIDMESNLSVKPAHGPIEPLDNWSKGRFDWL